MNGPEAARPDFTIGDINPKPIQTTITCIFYYSETCEILYPYQSGWKNVQSHVNKV